MNLPCVLLSLAGLVFGISNAGAADSPPASKVSTYVESPLIGDANRTVRITSIEIPSGGGNAFHIHPGDDYILVQEGEITFTVKGQAPKILKAGEGIYVPAGTIHRNQNLAGKPARNVEVFILEKGKKPLQNVD